MHAQTRSIYQMTDPSSLDSCSVNKKLTLSLPVHHLASSLQNAGSFSLLDIPVRIFFLFFYLKKKKEREKEKKEKKEFRVVKQ